MGRPDRSAIAVGFDGTESGRAAVSLAADEAARRTRTLRILHVVQSESAISAAAELLAQAADLAREHSVAEVDTEVLIGDPVEQFVERSAGFDLLVVGRGQADPVHTVLGSVAIGVMARAHCPVLVVGESMANAEGGTVVVGVDEHGAAEALELAFVEARNRGASVVAVHAWHYPESSGVGNMLPLVYAPDEFAREQTSVLHEAVRPFRERFPAVPVTEVPTESSATRALLEAAADARMLVLGSRERGPIKGLLLGSVGQWAVRHAPCPVLIAHARQG